MGEESIFGAMAIRDRSNLEENAALLLIGDLLEEKNFPAIQEALADYHPADIAFVLNLLEEEDLLAIVQGLKPDVQAEVIAELNEGKREYLVEHLDPSHFPKIIDNLDSDDAADLVGIMDKQSQEQVLQEVGHKNAAELRELLSHDTESAGGIMSKEVVSVPDTATVGEATQQVRKMAQITEQIYGVFVVDAENRLKGVVPLNKLVISNDDQPISKLIQEAVKVETGVDQEEVAKIVQRYDLVEIPVVDGRGTLLGRITHDDIIDVIEEEAEEDMAKLSGTTIEETHDHSAWEISRKRISWLIVGLFGGVISALIIGKFEGALDKVILLAFFIPVIMAMGGIVGIQSSSITVRSLALGEIQAGLFNKRVVRELGVGCINGVICSLLLGVVIYYWQNSGMLALVVGSAMFCVMMVSTLSGTLIPILLHRMKVDPGIATGPFVTTLNDLIGLLVYFSLASLVMLFK